MVRNLAVTLVVLALLVVFQPHIKAGIFEYRNAFSLARIELDEEKKEELRGAIARMADGVQADVFTDVELITITDELDKLRSHAGEELDAGKADGFLVRFETILERHKL